MGLFNKKDKDVVKNNYDRLYKKLGVAYEDYSDYYNKRIKYNQPLSLTQFLGKEIKRVNSSSFIHTVEGIFIEELYKFESNKPAPLIVDCGTNIGISIMYFKTLFPAARIIGFEPDKKIFDACQFNINAFGFKNVELHNSAVWKFDGTLNFLPDNSLGGMVVEDADKNNKVYQVEAADVKKYLDQEIDFLKIDIEGAELEVLEYCKDNLSLVKNLFVEYHSYQNKPQQLQRLLEILSNAGFRYYIKHAWDYLDRPFADHKKFASQNFDLQLNICAYRADL